MSNVSNRQVTQKPTTLVDPNNFLPPNVLDLAYEGKDTPADSVLSSDESGLGSNPIIGDGVDYSGISIISQTLRSDPTGKFVVDVVLGVPDKKGVVAWDVRLTRL
jgi:hypothetical protein